MFPFVLGGVVVDGAYQCWARVEQLTAKEVLENNKLTYKQPYRITIRYAGPVTNIERVEWNGVKIYINSVTQDARQTEKILVGYGE